MEARGWIRSLRVGASRSDRSFGKPLRDLTHPLMGSNRTLCSLDAQSGNYLLALQGNREDENIRWVSSNDGMELDDAGLFDKTGHGNGGVDALKGADHASTVGESVRDLQGAVD